VAVVEVQQKLVQQVVLVQEKVVMELQQVFQVHLHLMLVVEAVDGMVLLLEV
jgi:hypothetical protein